MGPVAQVPKADEIFHPLGYVKIKMRSGQCQVVKLAMKAIIKQRSAIGSVIGRVKMDERLGRNPLKGTVGNAMDAVLSGAGDNIRLPLKNMRLLWPNVA